MGKEERLQSIQLKQMLVMLLSFLINISNHLTNILYKLCLAEVGFYALHTLC